MERILYELHLFGIQVWEQFPLVMMFLILSVSLSVAILKVRQLYMQLSQLQEKERKRLSKQCGFFPILASTESLQTQLRKDKATRSADNHLRMQG